MPPSNRIHAEPALPVTTATIARATLTCLSVTDGDGIGLLPGQPLIEVIDDAEHERLISALGVHETVDLTVRHRDGRWLRLRARGASEMDEFALVILDDTPRARREVAARIEARTLRAFSRATTLGDAVQPLMEAMGIQFGLRFIELWLIDHRTGTLRRSATVSRGLPPFHLERVTGSMDRSLQEGFARAVAESDGIIWEPDLRQELRLLRRKEALLDGLQGVIGLRIGNDTRELGALLLFTGEEQQPEPELVALLERIGQQLSLLTFNLRRGELLQRSQRRLRFITDLSRALDATQEASSVARSVLEMFVPRIADAAILERPQPRSVERTILIAPEASLQPIDGAASAIPQRASGRIRLEPGSPLHALGARHALVASASTRDATLGRLILLSTDEPFDEEEELIAKEAARRAADAIEHAQLFTHRSHIARTLQESLLPPSLPRIDGFEIAARYEAAGDGIDSGGDFYDLFATGGSSWAAMIGDVQGKGPGAAAITALARYTLRAAALRARRPSRILTLLNDALYSNEQTDRSCTVAYARIVLGDGGVHAAVCLAGHLQPLLRSPDGSVAPVGAPGRFLGCFPETKLFDVDVDIPRGGSLILYTDGVTDARTRSSDEFGEQRLRALIESMPLDATADAIADQIRTDVLAWQRNELVDDVAILVLRWNP